MKKKNSKKTIKFKSSDDSDTDDDIVDLDSSCLFIHACRDEGKCCAKKLNKTTSKTKLNLNLLSHISSSSSSS